MPVISHSDSSVDAWKFSGPRIPWPWVDFSRLRPATHKQKGSQLGLLLGSGMTGPQPLPRNPAPTAAGCCRSGLPSMQKKAGPCHQEDSSRQLPPA